MGAAVFRERLMSRNDQLKAVVLRDPLLRRFASTPALGPPGALLDRRARAELRRAAMVASTLGRYAMGTIAIVAIAGCFTASVPPMSPKASTVAIRKGDPPAGAIELGPIEAQNGGGCGGFGARGTFEGAMAELRNTAAARGADYVVLVSQTEPHAEPACYVDGFVLRGIAYRLASPRSEVPPLPGGTGMTGRADSTTCDPPCSPGYRCSQAVCMPVCNPACGLAQTCRQDRTCVPGPPASAPSPPEPLPVAPPTSQR